MRPVTGPPQLDLGFRANLMTQRLLEIQETAKRPAHVLIVDDEAFVRSSLQLFLETQGYKVSVAEGGESALELLGDQQPPVDVVLLDLVMPGGLHGIEVLRRIKEIDSSVQVIIATGCGNMNTAIQALRLGAFDYITKPIVNLDEDLLKVVEAAMREHQEKLKCCIKRVAATSREDGLPVGPQEVKFCEAVEALVREITSTESKGLESAILGKFLESMLESVAAVAILEDASGSPRCMARWGAFAALEGPDGEREAILEASAILHLTSPGPTPDWQPVQCKPGAAGLSEASQSLEVLQVPLDLRPIHAEPLGGKLIVLRAARAGRRTRFSVPGILSLVAGRALLSVIARP
jgi:DNA-binding response OmpR family regulator